jgi:hypothetical protein
MPLWYYLICLLVGDMKKMRKKTIENASSTGIKTHIV